MSDRRMVPEAVTLSTQGALVRPQRITLCPAMACTRSFGDGN